MDEWMNGIILGRFTVDGDRYRGSSSLKEADC